MGVEERYGKVTKIRPVSKSRVNSNRNGVRSKDEGNQADMWGQNVASRVRLHGAEITGRAVWALACVQKRSSAGKENRVRPGDGLGQLTSEPRFLFPFYFSFIISN
jgi:hypothetical protein